MRRLTQFNILIILILLSIDAFPQAAANTPAVVQPTPPGVNAASLGKYGETQVSKYTGLPDISIPLWNIQEGDIKVPISISYHASGIKVEENASWVGLGWSLNAGGVITRSMRGQPDERGYLYNSVTIGGGSSNLPQITNLIPGALVDPTDSATNASICTISNACEYASAVAGGGADSEPDLYFFNFNGISGKFVLDQYGNAYTIPYQHILIQRQPDMSWVIVTQDGMSYIFDTPETTQPVSLSYSVYGGTIGDNTPASASYTSSWYLTKIQSPTGRSVSFNYTTESYTQTSGESEHLMVNLSSSTVGGPYYPTVTGSQMNISGQRLSSISYPSGSVSFVANTVRQDMDPYSNPNLLNAVVISNNSGVVKQFNFGTSYFTTTDAVQTNLTMRLRLDSLTECDPTGTVCKPAYKFTYDPVLLPSKISSSQDHWGYYNGAVNIDTLGNPTLLPDTRLAAIANINEQIYTYSSGLSSPTFDANYNDGVRMIQYKGANRAPHFNFGKAGVLEQITYPTGGYTQFQYEANDYALPVPIYASKQENFAVIAGPGITSEIGASSGSPYYVDSLQFRPADSIPASLLGSNPLISMNIGFSFNNGGQNAYCCGCTLPYAQLTDLTTNTILILTEGEAGYPAQYGGNIASQINSGTVQVQGTFSIQESVGGVINWVNGPYFNYSGIQLDPTHTYQIKSYTFPCLANACETTPTCNKPSADINTWAQLNVTYSYISNTVQSYNDTLGGIRIKRIADYSNPGSPIVKSYSYTRTDNPAVSSGIILDYPIYIQSFNYNTTIGTFGGSSFTALPSNLPLGGAHLIVNNTEAVLLTSGSKFELGQTNGSYVGYSTVSETDCPDTTCSTAPLGKIVCRYTTGSDYVDSNALVSGYVFFVDANCTTYSNSNYALEWGTPVSFLPTGNYFPYPPKMSYDWKRGLLTSEEYYDNNGNLKKKTQKFYNLPGDPNNSKIIHALKIVTPPGTATRPKIDMYFGRYDVKAAWNYQNSEVTTEIDNNGTQLVTAKNFYYDNPLFAELTRTSIVDSKGDTLVTRIKYPQDYIPSGQTYTGNTLLDTMLAHNIISEPIEKQDSLYYAGSSSGYVKGAQLKLYRVQTSNPTTIVGDRNFKLDVQSPITNFQPFSISGNVLSMDSRYRQILSYDQYDLKNNVQQYTGTDQNPVTIIWDYKNTMPIAWTKNAVLADVAATSFEADGNGGWSFSGVPYAPTTVPPTGSMCYPLSGNPVSKAGLTTSMTYVVSYWSSTGASYSVTGSTSVKQGKTINGWTYFEHNVTGVTSVTISGSGNIDELRLYPSTAQMTTYTYSPLIGMTTVCDVDNRVTYYNYDGLERLKWVKDQDGNIIKTFQYHYLGQPTRY